MPIYEYVCEDCELVFEALRSMNNADDLINCQTCGSEHTHRKPSVCFSESGGKAIAGSTPSCGSCAGGNCAGCGT